MSSFTRYSGLYYRMYSQVHTKVSQEQGVSILSPEVTYRAFLQKVGFDLQVHTVLQPRRAAACYKALFQYFHLDW